MPITEKQETGKYIYGVWEITESTGWFMDNTVLSSEEKDHCEKIRNELARKQWLANRLILATLLENGDREVRYDPNGKPFLASGGADISLSHSGKYAAAMVSRKGRTGIDIEVLGDRILRVAGRFMTPAELERTGEENKAGILYIHWCMKEAVYKLAGDPEVSIFSDIILDPFDYICNGSGHCTATVHGSNETFRVRADYRVTDGYFLVCAFDPGKLLI